MSVFLSFVAVLSASVLVAFGVGALVLALMGRIFR